LEGIDLNIWAIAQVFQSLEAGKFKGATKGLKALRSAV
jgi:hypothetical protein